MFHELRGTKSQDCPQPTDRRAEAESNRGPARPNRLTFMSDCATQADKAKGSNQTRVIRRL